MTSRGSFTGTSNSVPGLSLDLSAAVESILEQRLFVESRTTEGEKIEVEARLGVKPGKSGTDYLSWVNAYNFVRSIPGRRTHSKYTNTIVSDSTVSFRERAGNWIVKREIRSTIVSNNWVKVALSTEAPSQEPTSSSRARTVVRHIARHSFYIDLCRVDFSKTYTDGELTCEIEVEYLAPAREINTRQRYADYTKELMENTFKGSYKDYLPSLDKKNMKSFVDLILAVTSAMFGTPLPFTYQDLITVSAVCNAVLGKSYEGTLLDKPPYIDRRYLSEAKALDIKNLTFEFLFGRGITWTATLKVDGQRRVLVVCDKGTWLLFPPLQAAFYSLTDSHASTRITIADVELFEGEIWLIDALWVDGNDVRHGSHVSRYGEFTRWHPTAPKDLFTGLPVRYKKHNVVTGANFFRGITDTWEGRHGIGCPVDGIILTPNVRYEDTTNPKNRIIFKWKPEITIDLVTVRDNRGRLVVMVASDKGVLEPFVGNEQSRVERIDMGTIPYNRGVVVEFLCESRRLLAIRERPEKSGPNDSRHALDAWLKSTVDTLRVDEATLLGESNVLMRKYHNRIKSDLIMKSVTVLPDKEEELYLLDIGSGRGGDLAKWKKAGFTKMILVEPNEKNIADLEARLSAEDSDFQDRVLICHAHGQDFTTIKSFATKNGINKVHVVSMMDSLTYFFDRERTALAGLAKTINLLLPDGGVFIWKSMDGAAVKTAFTNLGEDTLVYGDSKIRRMDSNTVRVDIPPNQMNVTENLTDMLALKTVLNLSGEAQIAQGEAMLSETFKPLSRLFSYGLFIKGQRLEPTREMSAVLQYFKIKPLVPNDRRYKSAIEALEGTLSSKAHSSLISSYMDIARLVDQEYGAMGTEPAYFKFETAYRGYFSSLFLERSRTDTEVLELNILRDAPIRDPDSTMHASLAFASLLRLDVFIVNPNMELYLTNAIEGKVDNPACVIVCNGEEDYSFKLFSNKMPLALTTDAELQHYPRLPLSDFHETSLAAVQGDVGKLLTTTKRPATNVLNRLAYIDHVPSDVRLRSLANKLLNSASTSCTSADLQSCNIGGDVPKLIARVNYFMRELREN